MLKKHVSVKKVALVVAIMQKKIANAETAKLANVIAISMQHNRLKKRDLVLNQISFLIKLSKCN